jgi:hypothetical protein
MIGDEAGAGVLDSMLEAKPRKMLVRRKKA